MGLKQQDEANRYFSDALKEIELHAKTFPAQYKSAELAFTHFMWSTALAGDSNCVRAKEQLGYAASFVGQSGPLAANLTQSITTTNNWLQANCVQ